MNTYSLKYCETLIQKYIYGYNGEATIIDEGILGLGTVLLHNAEGKKTIVIQEVYLNPWSSTHTISKYNKMPEKYEQILNHI